MNHELIPRWPYDCDRCKFSWCCGPKCKCNYTFHIDDDNVGEPNKFGKVHGILPTPEYRLKEVKQIVFKWREERGIS